MRQRRRYRLLAIPLALTLLAAACGGDDDSDDSGAIGTDAPPVSDTDAGDDTDADETEVPATSDAAPLDTGASEDEPAEAVYGGDIAVGLEAEAVGLRPWEDACSTPCYNMLVTIYDKLMERTAEGDYEPFVAESIEPNEDFTTWTMTLRDGVTFHNGTELTAQTIADMFPIQQTGATGAGQISSSNLTGVEATGDLEVTYTLSASNSAFPAFLERAPMGMVFDPEEAAADPDGYSTAPIGTGPFMLETRDIDNETVVVRNENYWGTDADGNQLPYLDSISFRPIPDEGTRLDALLSGTVNAMHSLRQGTIRDAREETGITLYEYQGNNLGGGMFNVLVPPFDDKRVRNGLTMLNDQSRVIEALGGTGISEPGTQWFAPDSPYWSQAVADAWPEFDFEGGTALLAEYTNDPTRSDGKAAGEPIDVELSCPPDPTLIAAMQVIEQVWSATELVNVSLTQFDQQTHINNALSDTHQAHCWRWSDDNDPSVSINPYVAPPNEEIAAANGLEGVVSPLNFPNYFNPESFESAIAAIQTDDFDERKALYETIMLDIAEETPIWYSGHTATMIATDPTLEGIDDWTLPSGEPGAGFPSSEGRWLEVSVVG